VSITRRLTAAAHALDFAVGRLDRRQRVLVELRTPVYQAVLGPIAEALDDDLRLDVSYTSEYPDRIRPLVEPRRFVTHAEAEWTRYALYINADPWAAARLRRCEHRINFFHGVAGKYDLDAPTELPLGFQYYDRVAFINQDRMRRYLDRGIVTGSQAVLVGYPKLDRLAGGEVDGERVRRSLHLESGRPTILYAPTYSTASSLHLAGEAIVEALFAAGWNVVVKLHDRSLDADPRYTGGIDWRTRMRAIERPGRVAYVEGPDASPYLAAADALVTDHSSVGFEYLVLDRPLLIFDAPDLPAAARINAEKVVLLRSAGTVVATAEALVSATAAELTRPSRLSDARGRVAREMFFEPGSATGRAVDVIHQLLGIASPVADTTPADGRPATTVSTPKSRPAHAAGAARAGRAAGGGAP
jgi:hypothetical protein